MLKNNGKLITVVFAKDCTGYGSGVEIEPGTYGNMSKGRLQYGAYRHFFDKQELEDILEKTGFSSITIDFNKYSDGGSVVSQWIAVAEKLA